MRRLLSVLCLSLLATTAVAQNLINVKQWKVADGGNDHWYGIYNQYWWQVDAREKVKVLPLPPEVIADGITEPAYLASVLSSAENDFIRDSVLDGIDEGWSALDMYWLGGKSSRITGEWGWDTHEAFSHTNWGGFEPSYPLYENGLGIWGRNQAAHPASPFGTWNDSYADTFIYAGYTCRSIVEWGPLEGSVVSPVPEFPELINLTQWKSEDGGNNHWYAISPTNRTAADAQNIQVSPSAIAGTGLSKPHYLATITSGAEYDFVLQYIMDTTYPHALDPYYWSSGTRITVYHNPVGFTHKWLWQTGEPFVFSAWGESQPSIDGGGFTLAIRQHVNQYYYSNGDSSYYNIYNSNEWISLSELQSIGKYWSILEWGNPFCGDVDNNQKVNVLDISKFVTYLFGGGGPLPGYGNADASGDGRVNITDVTKIVGFLFASGGPLACAEW